MRSRTTLAALLLLLALAVPSAAQDAPPAEDPFAALRAAAEKAAPGAERAAAFSKLAGSLEAAGLWTEAAAAWHGAGAAGAAADVASSAAAGEARCFLAFAEEVLAAGEPGSAVRAAFEDARSALKRAQALGVKDTSIRIGLARCLAADGRTDDQIAELRAAAKDFPEDPAPPRALAFALYHAGRHAEAIAVFRPLSDAAPGDMNLTLTLAASARAVKDEALALAMSERALEKHPDDRRSWECLWAAYSADKRWGELADKMEAAAKAHPGNALGAYYSAFAASTAQRWDDALRRLDEVWKLDPRNWAARLEAGRIHFQQKKDRDAAAKAARDVLEVEPSNRKAADLLSFVAMRRSDEGDHAGAARELAVLAEKRPDDAIVRANLGLELRWAGRYREAEEAYRRAIELAPEDAQTRNDIGLLYLVLGRDAEAKETFLAGAAANPEANDCLENLGWMARRDGRKDEALSWFRKAYEVALRKGGDGARHRRHLDDVRYPLPPLGAPR